MTHYAYFGAVRADASNIGDNAAMLNDDGELTDVGSWYLGGNATGVQPDGNTATKPSLGDAAFLLILPALIALMLA